jgi:hypothetical protein
MAPALDRSGCHTYLRPQEHVSKYVQFSERWVSLFGGLSRIRPECHQRYGFSGRVRELHQGGFLMRLGRRMRFRNEGERPGSAAAAKKPKCHSGPGCGGRQRLGYGLLIDGAHDSLFALANNLQNRQRVLKVFDTGKGSGRA